MTNHHLSPILIIIIAGFIGLPICQAVCDGFAYGHCTSRITRGEDELEGIFFGTESLDQACKSYEEAATCMEDVLPDCMPEIEERWKITEQAFGYLCGSARLEFENYLSCYNKSDEWLMSDLMWCHRTKKDIQEVMLRTSRRWLPAQVHWVVCKMLREYETCVSHSIVRRCGIDAATWQREVLHQLLLPYLHEEKC